MSHTAYISGPLQAAGDIQGARRLYELLADICRSAGWDPYLPHQRTDPHEHADVESREVFRRDIEALRQAALVVAVIGTPSSGVGAELAFSYLARQPMITVWHESERPSRFIQGMLVDYKPGTSVVYRDEQQLRVRLLDALATIGEPQPELVAP